MGVFAPGIMDLAAASAATHHLLLGHGLAVQAMRAVSRQPLQIGITLNLNSIESATKSPQDLESANTRDIYLNRVFLILCISESIQMKQRENGLHFSNRL